MEIYDVAYNLRFLNALQTVKVPSPSTLSDVL